MCARISRSLVMNSIYPLYRNSEHGDASRQQPTAHLTNQVLSHLPVCNTAILRLMDALRHILTAALLALILNWLRRSSRAGKAKEEAGRKIFGPTPGIQVVTILCGVLFTALVVGSAIALRKPSDW